MNIGGWFAVCDNVMGRVILVPGDEAASGWCDKRIVVDDVAFGNDGFGETGDGFEVEQIEIGGAVFKHAGTELPADFAVGIFVWGG